jgi:chromosome segregation ATPase
MKRTAWLSALTCVALAAGCQKTLVDHQPAADRLREVHETAPGVVSEEPPPKDRDDFQRKLDERMKELDAQIAELRKKGAALKDEARVQWDKTMADLEKKRAELQPKIDRLNRSSAAAWEDIKRGTQAAWDDLEQAFSDASKHFQNPPKQE